MVAAGTGACRVDARVAVDAEADGSGRVTVTATLDPDAVTRLVGEAAGDPAVANPATRIKVDDLRDAGWTVLGPDETAAGGLRIVARHEFSDPAEAAALLAQVAGGAGAVGAPGADAAVAAAPIRDVRLRQERTFFKTRTTFAATVDLSDGLGAFTDPDLRTALRGSDGAPLGVTQEQLEQRFGGPLADLLGLDVAVQLPGQLTGTNAPTGAATWSPALGERAKLTAASEQWNVRNLAVLVVALVAAVALIVVLVRRRPKDRPLTVTESNITVPSDGEAGADGRGT